MSNRITLTVGGKKYGGWTSISVNRSIETLTGSFTFDVTDQKDPKSNLEWPLQTQLPVEVKLDNKLLITGFIDSVNVNVSANGHTISISGRDKTADLVDASADESGRKFSLSKTTLEDLARKLVNPFGIEVKTDTTTDITKSFSITFNSSETPFEILDRKAKEFGVILITDRKGRLIITNAGNEKANDNLIIGQNVISASASYDYINRFSKYTVFAQTSNSASWSGNINVSRTATDPNVTRNRPLIIQAEGQMNNDQAQKRANWEAITRAGKSQVLNMTIQGFKQSNGELWDINKLVSVNAPILYVNPAAQLLITSVNYELSNNGTFTRLALKRSDAFSPLPNNQVGREKKLGWS